MKYILLTLFVCSCTTKPVRLKELCWQKSDGTIVCKDGK